jgi:hypothetical protein
MHSSLPKKRTLQIDSYSFKSAVNFSKYFTLIRYGTSLTFPADTMVPRMFFVWIQFIAIIYSSMWVPPD